MDFEFTPEQEAFRKEVRLWLERNLPEDLRGRGFAASRAEPEEVLKLRAWQRRMYAAGYVGMDWPREFGGRGASLVEQIILYQEMARAESPQFVNRGGSCPASSPPTTSGARASPSPMRAPTSPTSRRARCERVTTSW